MNRSFSNEFVLFSVMLAVLSVPACTRRPDAAVTAAGVVDGDVVTLKAAVSGKIVKLVLSEGKPVSAEDLVAAVDSAKIRNRLEGLDIKEKELAIDRSKLERRIRLLSANREYWKEQTARLERLEKKDSVSGDQLEQALLKLEEAESSLYEARQSLSSLDVGLEAIRNQRRNLELLLDDHLITSPVSGVVLEKFVSGGETVFPGTPVADILDRSSLFVETFLEEREISRLRRGQKVDILVDGWEGRVFSGEIISFGQEAEFSPKYIISEKERRSLLYRVKVKILENLEIFKLGMPVTVRIVGSEERTG